MINSGTDKYMIDSNTTHHHQRYPLSRQTRVTSLQQAAMATIWQLCYVAMRVLMPLLLITTVTTMTMTTMVTMVTPSHQDAGQVATLPARFLHGPHCHYHGHGHCHDGGVEEEEAGGAEY